MKPRTLTASLWGAALLSLGLGASLTVATFRDLRGTRQALDRRGEELGALDALVESMQPYEAARHTYETIPGGRPVRLDPMLSVLGSRVDLAAIRDTVTELDDAWVLRKKEVVVGEGPLQEVLDAVRQAEAQRPPWRLEHGVIRASSHTPGYGSAVLTFAALEKSGA